VKEYERKGLLERVNREAATVGAEIPEAIEIQGEPIELQSFVFEIKRRDTVPPGERERVEQAKRNLRRERLERLEPIEENEVSYAEGEALAASIIGIDRALDAWRARRARSGDGGEAAGGGRPQALDELPQKGARTGQCRRDTRSDAVLIPREVDPRVTAVAVTVRVAEPDELVGVVDEVYRVAVDGHVDRLQDGPSQGPKLQ